MRALTISSTSAALLLALGAAACGDDKFLAPEEPVAHDSVSAAIANVDLLADPFVSLLIGSLKDRTQADAIRVALGRLAAGAEPAELGPLAEQLQTDADDIVALAALRLLLEGSDEVREVGPPGGDHVDRSGIRQPR